jgi:hypothetical protein
VAGSAGLVALVLPPAWRGPVAALGLAAALGPASPWFLVVVGPAAAVFAGAARRAGVAGEPGARALARAGAFALALAAAVAAKQWVAAGVLPAALEGVGPALRVGLSAAAGACFTAALPAGVSAADDGERGASVMKAESAPIGARLAAALSPTRALALGLLLVGAAAAGRLARLGRFPPDARLAGAVELHAVPLLYDTLLADAVGDRARLAALVRAAPLRDDAALALGPEEALAAGWRPQRAEGADVVTARALEKAGRGGEARRLLARHPRDGERDGLLALFERTQGEPVAWRGGPLGPVVPPTLDLDWELVADGSRALEFTLAEARSDVGLRLDGDAWNGLPTVDVSVDAPAGASSLVEIAGPMRVPLGPLDAGPHRLVVTFVNDAAGPGGDRNVRVLELGP